MTLLEQIAAAIGAAKAEDITVELDGAVGIQITINSERLHTAVAHLKDSYPDGTVDDPFVYAVPATLFARCGK